MGADFSFKNFKRPDFNNYLIHLDSVLNNPSRGYLYINSKKGIDQFGLMQKIREAVCRVFGCLNRSENDVIEYHIIQLITRGVKKQWINDDNFKQINCIRNTILQQMPGDKHTTLNTLVKVIEEVRNNRKLTINFQRFNSIYYEYHYFKLNHHPFRKMMCYFFNKIFNPHAFKNAKLKENNALSLILQDIDLIKKKIKREADAEEGNRLRVSQERSQETIEEKKGDPSQSKLTRHESLKLQERKKLQKEREERQREEKRQMIEAQIIRHQEEKNRNAFMAQDMEFLYFLCKESSHKNKGGERIFKPTVGIETFNSVESYIKRKNEENAFKKMKKEKNALKRNVQM